MKKIGFVDVGARGGVSPLVETYADRLHRVLVEPEAHEAQRLKTASQDGSLYTVIDRALGHIDDTIDLNVTANATCSSALRPNENFLSSHRYVAPNFGVVGVEAVPCARYDTLYAHGGLPKPSIIKIDTQGYEYQVLLGFGGLLQECYAVELETHVYPLYYNQKLLTDVAEYLSLFGLKLRHVSCPRSPNLRGDRHFDQCLVEIDAFFTKEKQWVAKQPAEVIAEFELACRVLDIDLFALG